MQLKQSCIVYVGLVHHVKRASLDVALLEEDIEYFDVVHFAVADVDKTGNRSLQVDQSMKFDGGFGGAKWSPTEQTQTQIDGRRIERIYRRSHEGFELCVGRFVGVKRSCSCNQMVRQIRKNFPRPHSIGVCQSVSRDGLAAQAHMIKMPLLSTQIDLDIAQRLACGQLSESQNEELVQTSEVLYFVLRSTCCNHATEGFQRQISHHLGEHKLT